MRSHSFLSSAESRRTVRALTVVIYFIIFQVLILLQKPFLQYDFIIVFYLSFGALFGHHLFCFLRSEKVGSGGRAGVLSYLFDFLILILFMKSFPYLSSFVLVLQLFLIFISSFDLDFFEICVLGFFASLGASLINLSSSQAGSVQSLLTLTLFNLSYLSVIIISRQLRQEFFDLQSDLSQTRRKWRSQEQFLHTLVERLPFGLAAIDMQGEILLRNSYLHEKLRMSDQQLQQLMAMHKSSHQPGQQDIPYNTETGQKKILNLDRTSYFDENVEERMNLYLVKDVTDLRSLENQLKQSEKLAAVGQLAAGIAHEIRNPLAGISGSIQMLSQDYAADPQQKKLMDIVIREIDRLNLLITDFLNYAKPEKPPDQGVDLKPIIEEVLILSRRHPDVSAGLVLLTELQNLRVLGFSEKLKQAFHNICINSLQSMKDRSQQKLEVRLTQQGDWARLSIKDSGVGMSEETKKKMFEPFHTTKAKGTGLGLAITYKILEVHRAQIEVHSELNIGTEFVIKFPLSKGEQKELR